MAVAINRVLIGGHLTRDPEVRFLNAGTDRSNAVANFAIAINRRFKGNDGQMKDEVAFVDIEAWGRTAELVGQYLTKGRAVFIEGHLKLDQWQDKEGKNRQRLKVVAESVQFLDSSGKSAAATPAPVEGVGADGAAPAAKPARTTPAGDDEPPF